MLLLVCYLPLISVPTVRIPDKEDLDEDEDDNYEVYDGKHEDATQHNYHPLKAGGQQGPVSSVSPKQDLILLQIGLWVALQPHFSASLNFIAQYNSGNPQPWVLGCNIMCQSRCIVIKATK